MGLGILIALAYPLSLSFYGVIHLTGLLRKAGAAATPPPPPEIIGAAASRIGDGGVDEGSEHPVKFFKMAVGVMILR